MISDRIVVLCFFFFFIKYKVTPRVKRIIIIYTFGLIDFGAVYRAQSKCSTRFSDVVINTRNIVIDYWAQYLFYA